MRTVLEMVAGSVVTTAALREILRAAMMGSMMVVWKDEHSAAMSDGA